MTRRRKIVKIKPYDIIAAQGRNDRNVIRM